MSYNAKYLKYKHKYLSLKAQYSDFLNDENNIDALFSELEMTPTNNNININNIRIVDLVGGTKKREEEDDFEITTDTTINNIQSGGNYDLESSFTMTTETISEMVGGKIEVNLPMLKTKKNKKNKGKKVNMRSQFFDNSDLSSSTNTSSEAYSDSTLTTTNTDSEL
jgi:hypothetical protein